MIKPIKDALQTYSEFDNQCQQFAEITGPPPQSLRDLYPEISDREWAVIVKTAQESPWFTTQELANAHMIFKRRAR